MLKAFISPHLEIFWHIILLEIVLSTANLCCFWRTKNKIWTIISVCSFSPYSMWVDLSNLMSINLVKNLEYGSNHKPYSQSNLKKKCLSPFNHKSYLLDDGITTLAYGYRKIPKAYVYIYTIHTILWKQNKSKKTHKILWRQNKNKKYS